MDEQNVDEQEHQGCCPSGPPGPPGPPGPGTRVEEIARAFHETYEEIAPRAGWETQERCRVEWGDLPAANRNLMVAVVQRLLNEGVIR